MRCGGRIGLTESKGAGKGRVERGSEERSIRRKSGLRACRGEVMFGTVAASRNPDFDQVYERIENEIETHTVQRRTFTTHKNATVLVFAGLSFNTFQLPLRKPSTCFCGEEAFFAASFFEEEVGEGTESVEVL